MNHPIRLSALAATLAAVLPTLASAQSNVTVYGIIDVTVRHANNAAANGDSLKTVGDGAYTGSRLGFRGTEDLGGGLKAFFNIEQGLDPSNGTLQQTTTTANYGQGLAPSGRAWGRAAVVGLSSGYGTVAIGRQNTLAHDLSGRFQPQPNPNQDSLSVFSGHHVSREDNMVKYTHKLGDFGVAASVTAGEGTNGKAWAVGGSYSAGPIDVVFYNQEMDSANNTETRKITAIGGSYAVTGGLRVFVGAMQRKHDVSPQKNKVWTLGANYNLTEALVLTASYVQDKQSGTNEGSRKVGYLGVDYLLSKRTDVYAEVDNNKLSGAFPLPGFMGTRDSATGVSVGVRHRF
ncbi:MAG: porin [Piscinibacter sp.]